MAEDKPENANQAQATEKLVAEQKKAIEESKKKEGLLKKLARLIARTLAGLIEILTRAADMATQSPAGAIKSTKGNKPKRESGGQALQNSQQKIQGVVAGKQSRLPINDPSINRIKENDYTVKNNGGWVEIRNGERIESGVNLEKDRPKGTRKKDGSITTVNATKKTTGAAAASAFDKVADKPLRAFGDEQATSGGKPKRVNNSPPAVEQKKSRPSDRSPVVQALNKEAHKEAVDKLVKVRLKLEKQNGVSDPNALKKLEQDIRGGNKDKSTKSVETITENIEKRLKPKVDMKKLAQSVNVAALKGTKNNTGKPPANKGIVGGDVQKRVR